MQLCGAFFWVITVAATCVLSREDKYDFRSESEIEGHIMKREAALFHGHPLKSMVKRNPRVTRYHNSKYEPENELFENKKGRHIVKREASVLIDSYPLESMTKRSPRLVVKRVSRGRYHKRKPKYTPPTRKPMKRRRPYQNKSAKKPNKYPPANYKKRSPKPRHSRPRPPKPKYGPPKHVTEQVYKAQEPEGFGEPPSAYPHDSLMPKPNYDDLPVDSYGAPLKPPNDVYTTAHNFPESQLNGNNQNQDQPWSDNNIAFSNKLQVFAKPDVGFDDTEPIPIDFKDDVDFSSHNLRMHPINNPSVNDENKKKILQHSDSRFISRPWKLPNMFEEEHKHRREENKVLVGGQYAEPPARYIPKLLQNSPIQTGDDEFAASSFLDSEIPASATMSPYVNYKNSNMAFSPQNLNDAFSIVDK